MKNYINNAFFKNNMEMRNALKKLNKSSEFLAWSKNNKKSKLAYAFTMDEEDNWQFGYYNNETDMISTFIVDNCISLNESQEIFKKPGDKVKCINLKDVKISFENALEKAEQTRKKYYSNEASNKKIAILQNIKQGQLWNITFVTHSFKTINIKIDALDGKLIKHEIVSLFEFKSKAK
jgi:hypothetical protein